MENESPVPRDWASCKPCQSPFQRILKSKLTSTWQWRCLSEWSLDCSCPPISLLAHLSQSIFSHCGAVSHFWDPFLLTLSSALLPLQTLLLSHSLLLFVNANHEQQQSKMAAEVQAYRGEKESLYLVWHVPWSWKTRLDYHVLECLLVLFPPSIKYVMWATRCSLQDLSYRGPDERGQFVRVSINIFAPGLVQAGLVELV